LRPASCDGTEPQPDDEFWDTDPERLQAVGDFFLRMQAAGATAVTAGKLAVRFGAPPPRGGEAGPGFSRRDIAEMSG